MKHLIEKIILTVIVVMDIVDGDFKSPGALDFIKWALIIICFALLLVQGAKKHEPEKN